jgi:hypothetical protein
MYRCDATVLGMTQAYINQAAVQWMREGRCPECGCVPKDHTNDNRFWMPRRLNCDLMQQGVLDRIAKQREIDDELEAT